jgi:Leucine-rich repeat (LRR) protein
MVQLTSLTIGRWFPSRITDDGLKHLKELTNLESLDLSKSQVTFEGLKQLQQLRKLIYLRVPSHVYLEYITLFPSLEIVYALDTTEKELQHLSKLNNIKVLGIQSHKITDEAIQYLIPLKSLQELYLFETQITTEGFAKLKNALPACEIEA